MHKSAILSLLLITSIFPVQQQKISSTDELLATVRANKEVAIREQRENDILRGRGLQEYLHQEAINDFFRAAKDGDVRTLKLRLRGGIIIDRLGNRITEDPVDVNTRAENGYTALTFATHHKKKKIVQALLKVPDIDVNAQITTGNTALIIAAEGNELDILEALLKDPRINVNARTESGYTALIIAAERGHKDVIARLLQVPGILINAKNEGGYTALMYASFKGYADIVNALLAVKEIDVNAGRPGNTALQFAIRKKHTEIVQMLRGSGAIE